MATPFILENWHRPTGEAKTQREIRAKKKPPAMHEAQRAENYLTRTIFVRLS
jgi:hypothetical protein